ncbi:carbohydrate binding domain-containing protein [Hymenobacter jeollabukensis]|uniref:CBM-cenC domain-containing protein n=1 Tax=Hymenobacter jeollabukensis TaxID=2025313 RepID=A0A5R8WUT5_9BACT|nr:carbohydrate binding domain-containing protein [Hymenobacter jeollabukensis]TLM95263.1 hypothetical protein FDY95_05605 [Hymenobacter jeollabukensis]
MKKVLYALTALCMVSCGDKTGTESPNRLAGNDFEAMEGWVNDPSVLASLTTAKAHSGRYAVKVDPSVEYSTGYNNLLGKLSPTKLTAFKVRAWVFLAKANTPVKMVIGIANPTTNKQLLWEGVDLGPAAKAANKWVEIEKTITLPAEATSTDRLSIYMWRTPAAETAYIDDMVIEKAE